MTKKDQDYCSRCDERCKPEELIAIVSRDTLGGGIKGKFPNIILVCERCHESYLDWIKDGRESKQRRREYNMLKRLYNEREKYRDDEELTEKIKRIEERIRKQLKREYDDELEWWFDKRFGTDKRFCKKNELSDDEKEEMK